MLEFSSQTTGMGVASIQLPSQTMIIVTDHENKFSCALFQDREDSSLLGRLRCSEILASFSDTYASTFHRNKGINLRDFSGFHDIIHIVLQDAVKPVIARLQSFKGILHAMLVTESGTLTCPSPHLDPFRLLTSLQVVIKTLHLFHLWQLFSK